jgi:hypothetical protein
VGKWWLHHDNAPAHKALSVKQFFNQKQHDPASPPAIFTRLRSLRLLFIPPIETSAQRKMFADVEEAKKKTTKALKGIILQEFQDCFEKWKIRLDQCIGSNGQRFKGDQFVTPKNKYTIVYY